MPDELLESSVQRKPTADDARHVVIHLASIYDQQVPKWWSPDRDAFFRDFWISEPILASAIYSIAARNAAFGWDLSGLPEDVQWAQRLLQGADFGNGWQSLITKTTIDTLVCDNGAFWEIIRPAHVEVDGLTLPAVKQYYENNEEAEWFALRKGKKVRLRGRDYKLFDSPLDLPIGIAHLDSGRVTRTGDPETPAIYRDVDGRSHKMKWWQIISFTDMPSPIEEMNGVGISALSRVFRYAHTLQSLSVYKDEKLSGQFARAVHITNADPQLIQDQMTQAQEAGRSVGLQRYSQPIIASTFDPNATPTIATIDLAGMPDGFEEKTTLEWYISVLALALGVDYGFLAPLPGKGLGTASQSEVQARQARGKSSRLFMDTTSNAINFRGILPESVRFQYIERDPEQELSEENVKKARAETRQIMIKSGEISPQIARQIATDDGDLQEKYLNAMGEQDLTPDIQVRGDDNVEAQRVVLNSEAPQQLFQGVDLQQESESQESAPSIPENEPVTAENVRSLEKGRDLDIKVIKLQREKLFPRKSLVTQIKNAARQTVGKKQTSALEDALDVYAGEVADLALATNDDLINVESFITQLSELATMTLLAMFAQGLGRDEYDTPESLLEKIQVNRVAAESFGDAILSGRYTDNGEAIVQRAELWKSDASYAYHLGVVNNPDHRETRYEFVLGPTAEHCKDCARLHGQVHTGQEWLDNSQWLPQSRHLACSGFRCLCFLVETDAPINGNF